MSLPKERVDTSLFLVELLLFELAGVALEDNADRVTPAGSSGCSPSRSAKAKKQVRLDIHHAVENVVDVIPVVVCLTPPQEDLASAPSLAYPISRSPRTRSPT